MQRLNYQATEEMVNTELIRFIRYVNNYYGADGIFSKDITATELEIVKACTKYYEEAGESWGGGDSIDRERVRKILQPNYSPNL